MLDRRFRWGDREPADTGFAHRSEQGSTVGPGSARRSTTPGSGPAPCNALAPLLGDLEVDSTPPLEALCLVLDRHSDPLFIVDASRKLHFWNVSARRVLETRQSLRLQRGRFSLGSPPDDRRLEELLRSMQSSSLGRASSRGLRLHRPGAQRGWAVAIHPLEPRQPQGEGASLFLFHAVSRRHSRGTLDPLLRDLFGLTPGEMAAATALLRTGSVGNAARALSVSRETIRTQLKAVFRKCDIHSTLELAVLLGSASLFLGPDPIRVTPRQWSEPRRETP
jgi:DNA-binding CsgD family transcriptional regulator